MNQYVRTAALILTGGALILVLGFDGLANYSQSARSLSNRDRLDRLEKHDHRMEHNHTDDAMAVQYGRVNTGTPSYLAGIGGWY